MMHMTEVENIGMIYLITLTMTHKVTDLTTKYLPTGNTKSSDNVTNLSLTISISQPLHKFIKNKYKNPQHKCLVTYPTDIFVLSLCICHVALKVILGGGSQFFRHYCQEPVPENLRLDHNWNNFISTVCPFWLRFTIKYNFTIIVWSGHFPATGTM